jgi:DNA-directed RNA polymerase subunit N
MMIPIRCWTCGTPIGHLWEEYQERTKKEDKKKVLDSFQNQEILLQNSNNGSCRFIDTVSKFKKV